MRLRTACVVMVAVAFLGIAQEATPATVTSSESPDWGTYLTDAEGNALYLYLEDEGASGSACGDDCVNNWPPLEVDGDPVAGEGVQDDLLGVLEREDGRRQVTYGDWPLYRFARDAEPGDVRGQGLGGAFFLVGLEGEALTEELPEEAREVDEELMAALMEEGESTFRNICSTCHGDEGQGLVGPGLDGMAALERASFIVNRILYGRPEHGMPAFADRFSDRDVAAVATFVRNSWSNDYGIVTEEEVMEGR